jgi:hypothetical protein
MRQALVRHRTEIHLIEVISKGQRSTEQQERLDSLTRMVDLGEATLKHFAVQLGLAD